MQCSFTQQNLRGSRPKSDLHLKKKGVRKKVTIPLNVKGCDVRHHIASRASIGYSLLEVGTLKPTLSFRYLVKFLAKLAQESDINKMTPSNIAIVLGPNLLWPKTEG